MNPASATAQETQRPALARTLERALHRTVVGQEAVIQRLLVALTAGGHVLLEGVPGLAKTLLIRTLANALHADFRRIQFTPDLLPSDLLGTLVLKQDRGGFAISKGPVFANIVLADEVNRAPAKVQSALLEAMEEGQVTLGGRTLALPEPFFVLATQNPLEHQGTYPLAEAQLDRFMMQLDMSYPKKGEELEILRRAASGPQEDQEPVASAAELSAARCEAEAVGVSDHLLEYVVAIIRATREPAAAGMPELQGLIEYGASPRAGVWMVAGARARAWLRGRAYAVPEDVKVLAADVLRHRLVLTFEASARGVGSQQVIEQILAAVPVP